MFGWREGSWVSYSWGEEAEELGLPVRLSDRGNGPLHSQLSLNGSWFCIEDGQEEMEADRIPSSSSAAPFLGSSGETTTQLFLPGWHSRQVLKSMVVVRTFNLSTWEVDL